MITKRTKYGLKALVYLAQHEAEYPIQTSKIAEAESLSFKFLESIMATLKKNNIVNSKKGKYGGYQLSKPADQIKMVDIIRILEGPIALVPCVSLNYYRKCDDCVDEETCAISKMMVEVRDSMLSVLRNKTLAEVANIEQLNI